MTNCLIVISGFTVFQLTRSRGAWRTDAMSRYGSYYISTHTLTWSVTFCRFCYLLYLDYFNSHAHVERDSSGVALYSLSKISTHTLTWSVTLVIIALSNCDKFQLTRSRGAWLDEASKIDVTIISTHTLTWSVTKLQRLWPQFLSYFNSHAHVERDRIIFYGVIF